MYGRVSGSNHARKPRNVCEEPAPQSAAGRDKEHTCAESWHALVCPHDAKLCVKQRTQRFLALISPSFCTPPPDWPGLSKWAGAHLLVWTAPAYLRTPFFPPGPRDDVSLPLPPSDLPRHTHTHTYTHTRTHSRSRGRRATLSTRVGEAHACVCRASPRTHAIAIGSPAYTHNTPTTNHHPRQHTQNNANAHTHTPPLPSRNNTRSTHTSTSSHTQFAHLCA